MGQLGPKSKVLRYGRKGQTLNRLFRFLDLHITFWLYAKIDESIYFGSIFVDEVQNLK